MKVTLGWLAIAGAFACNLFNAYTLGRLETLREEGRRIGAKIVPSDSLWMIFVLSIVMTLYCIALKVEFSRPIQEQREGGDQ